MNSNTSSRIWEIDFLRGNAVLLMILFHFVYNLRMFFGFDNIQISNGFWYYEGRITATLFMLLVGISTVLVCERYGFRHRKKNVTRGLQLLGIGFLLSYITWLYDPSMMIHFGMLHFLGISIIISSLFVDYEYHALFFAMAILGLTVQYQGTEINNLAWLPIGFPPVDYHSFDYYPMLPHLAIPLFGVFLGNQLYRQGESRMPVPEEWEKNFVSVIGRHSLMVYLLHQPLMLVLMYAILSQY